MKPFFMIFSLLLLFSCGDSDTTSDNNGANNGNNGANNGNNGSSSVKDFDCSTFFEKGDYSSACFPGSELPAFTQTSPTATVCFYKMGKQAENPADDIISVNLSVHELSIAKQVFVGLRNSPEGDLVEVSGIGDDAFRYETTKTKILHVRYQSVLIALTVQNNTPSPCTFETDELEKFAKLIVANIK